MDNQVLQNLVERITRELLAEMETKKCRKRVLFIFCDSTAHEAFMDQFISLKTAEIDHDLMFLDGETSAWLGIQQIQSTGAGTIIAADEYAKAPIELPKDYDAIIIPELDLDNAARICHGLKGSVKAEIIFSSLVLNKPVIVGEDCPGLKRADRRTLLSLELPDGYLQRFEKYKAELKTLGIHFVKQDQLHEEIKALFQEKDEDRVSREPVVFPGKVLTAQDVAKSNTIHVIEGTIITPLAKEMIKDKGITLNYSREAGL